jgi:hypothetical protein
VEATYALVAPGKKTWADEPVLALRLEYHNGGWETQTDDRLLS